jgi:hypothetical protein
MNIAKRARIAVLGALVALPLTAGAGVAQQQAAPKHHSKLKGAVVGAAAGHMLGHHAVAGAAAGAMIQHHRNHKAKSAMR